MRIIMAVLVLLLIILIEEVFETIYKKSNRYRKKNEQRDRLMNVPKKLDVVNIGSGPAYYGIDYTYCYRNGYNLATAPQNFEYGYKLLKRFSHNIEQGATVLITIMAPMSFGKNNDIHRRDYADNYYGILQPGEIENYSIIRAFVLSHPLLFAVVNKIRRVLKRNCQSKNAQSIVDVWTKEFGLNDLYDEEQAMEHYVTFVSKIDLLAEMVEFCRSNNWKPVIIIPPIPEVTRENISESFLNAFIYNNLNTLNEKVGDVKILNYYDDLRFGMDLFRNDIFLNEKGSEVFSKSLFDDICLQEDGAMMGNHFILSNKLHIPAIGMGTGWMNMAYKNPKFLAKRIIREIVDRITGKYSKDNKYNASYELRKLIKFSSSIKKDAELGYQMFDTAFSYNNCKQMGRALQLDKNRKDYFIISKCSNYHQRNNTVLEEFENTLRDFDTDYIDLFLIHWPQTGCYKNTWKILEDLYKQGKVKAIGVSNFSINQLNDLMGDCRIVPMVNEVECHPMLQQNELREFCKQHGIRLIAHTPTGKMRSLIRNSCISDIATRYNKSISQVILRWHYQLGDISIPNSLNPKHAKENLEIFDFELNDKDMEEIGQIDCNNRIWPDPENCDFTKL